MNKEIICAGFGGQGVLTAGFNPRRSGLPEGAESYVVSLLWF